MTETLEKKGMTLITDSFVCRTLQFQERLEKLLYDIHTEFPEKVYSLELLFEKFSGFLKTNMDDGGRFDALIKAAAELTSQEAPRWEMIAGWLLDFRFSEKLKEEEKSIGISDLYEKIVYLTEKGLYGSYIMENYSKEEIVEAESYICKERNRLFNYSGLDLLIKRYVISTHRHVPLESPQEMFLGIALHLAMSEKRKIRLPEGSPLIHMSEL